MPVKFVRDCMLACIAGAILGLTLAALTGCTPAQNQPEYLGAGLKIAVCVDNVLREEQARRAEAERELRELGERTADDAEKLAKLKPIDQLPEYRVDAGVSAEIDKVLRDGGTAK